MTTASSTAPLLLYANSQMRPGVPFRKPIVAPDGTVMDSADATSITAYVAVQAGVAARKQNHTGSLADGMSPASVLMASVSALRATEARWCR